MIIETNNYNIFTGGLEVFDQLQVLLSERNYSKIFILVDQNTDKHCLNKISLFLDIPYFKLLIKPGEIYKNLETCSEIWKFLSDHKADRKSLFINIGGGVIGDMGGFCASTYKRGIDFINIPTTLLAQVDASVGGKLGIDFQGLKNQIGIFSEPQAVFICSNFLDTLSDRERMSGFAEIIKHALIVDKNYWNQIKDFSENNLTDIINKSVMIKKEIVNLDPEEKNIRKKLNFGHTIGHAIESFSLENDEDPLTHGECIAIGMICESYISYQLNDLQKKDLEEITTYILSKYPKYYLDPERFPVYLNLMKNDKKNENDNINFTLLKEIGLSEINKYSSFEQIYNSFEHYNKF